MTIAFSAPSQYNSVALSTTSLAVLIPAGQGGILLITLNNIVTATRMAFLFGDSTAIAVFGSGIQVGGALPLASDKTFAYQIPNGATHIAFILSAGTCGCTISRVRRL